MITYLGHTMIGGKYESGFLVPVEIQEEFLCLMDNVIHNLDVVHILLLVYLSGVNQDQVTGFTLE